VRQVDGTEAATDGPGKTLRPVESIAASSGIGRSPELSWGVFDEAAQRQVIRQFAQDRCNRSIRYVEHPDNLTQS
jgi:hypothetical protein